jgi:3-methyl-2-oxobutanoate hydroxymethyltransferase
MLAISSGPKRKFVKQYCDIGNMMKDAFRSYIEETEKGLFPEDEHSFKMDETVISELKRRYKPQN